MLMRRWTLITCEDITIATFLKVLLEDRSGWHHVGEILVLGTVLQ